ncbi:hypothetical protein NECAME_14820, partial [Necator americanus]
YLLLPFSPDEPLHFGHKFNLDKARKTGYHSGGAGYVLSREALRRFGRAFNKEKTCGTKGKTVEDLEMGKCLETIGVRIGDSRDQEGFNRFDDKWSVSEMDPYEVILHYFTIKMVLFS